ncbi:ABC-2 type transport system permease protein [Geodermatophilus dictyosporus]|uniref:ABC-2 type transport system permease protein n=1 Tax=Geodermatophilus dictyosporus TaxID=1523247 RepID=A0A1I5T0J8_9ACTN|nr:ABC transporter permease [Geodermatophilus dictyosporus]SFP75976.1 ABC-2 type transport system permease protein [Geodermatophilus dictyosporus]
MLLPAASTVFFTQVFAGTPGGVSPEQAAATMVAMMAHGAVGAALGATVRLSFDRASGWLRQLRVTPVPQTSVVAVDVAVGMLLTLPPLVVVALTGRFLTGVRLAPGEWAGLVGVLWLGSAVFVALGLLLGWALEERAAGGAVGIVGTVLAALGGLWVPVELFPSGLRAVAHGLPSYWYAEAGHAAAAGRLPPAAAVAALTAFVPAFGALAAVVARRRSLPAVAG